MKEVFRLSDVYEPCGDQPGAIDELVRNIQSGIGHQVLLGVTGSGKTFTMANVIHRCGRPALIMAPNKTLAAQLYGEFKSLFPDNAVEYFVSYYDYYQPEAYLPQTDLYIEKDSSINEDLDKLRHAATHALLTRKDVIIVASVSCIYGLGSPEYYARMVVPIEAGQKIEMEKLIGRLIEVQYERNDYDFHRGTFRVRGDVLEIIPAYSHERALRLEFFDDELERIVEVDPLTGNILGRIGKTVIFPATHYISDRDNLKRAMDDIREELRHRLTWFESRKMLVEAQRLEQRTNLDLEMIEEMGYCNGIENYSRHLDGRPGGSPPACLLNYFPKDYLLFIDESHITVPQIGGMYNGDISRKSNLVDYGFRLPSALDNRPLSFVEFQTLMGRTIYVSATPGPWEMERSQGLVVEQIIRPTGLVDPEISIRPTKGQIDDLLSECRLRVERDERVLVTTLTKRMAEDLTDYLNTMGVSARYLHSDIDTMERMAILKSLRNGEFYVLVGINLLREGLDLPEVSLVAILDADKEGFLRSTRSLIQTFGRAARNVNGRVILYADAKTASISEAIDETERRRRLQLDYNEIHGIVPRSVSKAVDDVFSGLYAEAGESESSVYVAAEAAAAYGSSRGELEKKAGKLEREMRKAAKELDFERAATLRDRIAEIRKLILSVS